MLYGWDTSVGIATRYGLDSPGNESRWRKIFCTHPDRPWGPLSLLYSEYRVSFPRVKRPGRGVDHPPPSCAEVKERIVLYFYSLSGPSWPVRGRTLPFPLLLALCDFYFVSYIQTDSSKQLSEICDIMLLNSVHNVKNYKML